MLYGGLAFCLAYSSQHICEEVFLPPFTEQETEAWREIRQHIQGHAVDHLLSCHHRRAPSSTVNWFSMMYSKSSGFSWIADTYIH